jgi:hypothetical protein
MSCVLASPSLPKEPTFKAALFAFVLENYIVQ